VAAVYHNIGNLESAAGKAELALDYFRKVEEIRKKQGVAAENQLALLYLCMGRCYSSQGKYKEAMEMLQRSESLFVRTIGADKHFMAQ
jgi:tetratricopeptide (TPR) repeat protein